MCLPKFTLCNLLKAIVLNLKKQSIFIAQNVSVKSITIWRRKPAKALP